MRSSDMTCGMKVFFVDFWGWREAIVLAPRHRAYTTARPEVALAILDPEDRRRYRTAAEAGSDWVPRFVQPQQVRSIAQYEEHEAARRAKNAEAERIKNARDLAHEAARAAAERLAHYGFVVSHAGVSTSYGEPFPTVVLDVRTLPYLEALSPYESGTA